MTALVLTFADGSAAGSRFAAALDLPCWTIEVHRFPDRECRIRIPASAETVLIYRSLNDPDAKIIELLFAAAAARDGGARQVILVAPYLAYMRQDKAFRPGEAISQRVISRLVADHFDALATVDPHLHRVTSLAEVVPGIPALSVSAAPLLANLIDPAGHPLIAGPDGEAAQWTASIARARKLEVLSSTKERRGDRDIAITIHQIERVRGRPVILVDDVIASGETIARAAALLWGAGASRVEAIATHCLATNDDLKRLYASGIARLTSTDSIDGPTARVHLAELLATTIRAHGEMTVDFHDRTRQSS